MTTSRLLQIFTNGNYRINSSESIKGIIHKWISQVLGSNINQHKMKKERLISIIVIIFFVSMVIVSCTKDKVTCLDNTELIDQNHLVDIQPLNQASEFNETLIKYPQLQVYRVIDDQYVIGMHCNVFYQGLIVFSDQYALFKIKSDNSVFSSEDFIVDTVDFSLAPSLTYTNAINTAKQNMDFSKTCVSYRLGIFDLNSGLGIETKDYRLVWKVQGENGYPYVVLDANDGQVYREHDGLVN